MTGTLVGYSNCTPELVGQQLARALATLLCRERHQTPAPPCLDCGTVGRALAKPVARALVATAVAYRRGPLELHDYQTVGRVLEDLEAGIRVVPTGRGRSPD